MCASLPTHYADQNKVHVDILGGVAFVYLLSTWSRGQGGGGVKFGSNLVHAVIECPLNGINYVHLVYFFHSIAFEINSRNLSAYCSGSTVEMPSTLDPYLTVFATLAACFLTPEKHSLELVILVIFKGHVISKMIFWYVSQNLPKLARI